MWEILNEYRDLFIALAWGSIILLIIGVAITPWLVIKIPADYFDHKRRIKLSKESKHPLLSQLFNGIRNVVGFTLIVLGVVMLVLPGQGILTILIGLFLMNFPGKFRLERKLIAIPKVLKSLNWIRAKANKEPFVIS